MPGLSYYVRKDGHVIGFALNMLIRGYHIHKIRKLYGDGKEGYLFDVKNEDIRELNKQNQPIVGEYDNNCAVKTKTGIYVGEEYKETILYLGVP